MPQFQLSEQNRTNPLDVVERIAAINDWSFERAGDDEITMLVGGRWSDYQVSFTWMHDIEALHLACAFDLKVPERRRTEILTLVSLVNEQLWVGHFDLWSTDNVVMFRHSLVLAGGVEATASMGGQIMPPVMGAVAFLMIEYLGLPLTTILTAALVPAFMHFFGVLVQVHLEAKRLGLRGRARRAAFPTRRGAPCSFRQWRAIPSGRHRE